MWKYIVTYFVVVVTPIVKNSGNNEPIVIGFKIPKNTFYIDVRADTTKNTQHFDSRNEAEQFIEQNDESSIINYQANKTIFILNLKLDSIKVKK